MKSPHYKKTILDNGIRVVTEKHPNARGVAVGFWIMMGTRDESPREAGMAHFVEHLVFKRTKNRNAFEIARDMEAVGGELNAFTSREYTCFYTHSLKEHLGLSIDVLSDLVCRADFKKEDFEKEKQVVIQEILMSEDNLEEFIYDSYFESLFAKHPLGKPILGSVKSVKSFKIEDVKKFYKEKFASSNIVVSVAGNIDHDEVVKILAEKLVPKIQKKRPTPLLLTQKYQDKKTKQSIPELHKFQKTIEKPGEQVHMLVGIPAAHFTHHLRFEAYILNALLGGGMTSRLYQRIREDKGLVYSVYSQLSTFSDVGSISIYSSAEPKNIAEVLEITIDEIEKLKTTKISEKELELYKTQVIGQILLGADDIENRMNSLGVNEMVFGFYRPVDDVLTEIKRVSVDSLTEYIREFVDFDRLSIMLMGAVKSQNKSKKKTRK